MTGTFNRFDRPEPLTSHAGRGARLLTGGYSNREIAATLHLTEGTVKNMCRPSLKNLASETALVQRFAVSSSDTAPPRRPRMAPRKGDSDP